MCLDTSGLTNDDDTPWDDDDIIKIQSIDDHNINTDIETEVIHL
jgi:hypothetical protein